MAFFQQVVKAQRLKNARLNYHDEKLKSIAVSKGAKVHYNIFQKIRYTKLLVKKRIKDFLKKLVSCPEDTWFHKKALLLQTDGTFENYVLKSIFGFLGGILLTYLFFIFFVFQLHFSLPSATIWCSLLGIILTLGLAFSKYIRCLVFLIMPQFLSKRGRQALLAYAFILALTGPAKNTLNNIGVLSQSLSCGEEHLKEAVKAILDLIREPFNALKDAITKVLKTVKNVVKKIKNTLIAIKRLVLSILKVIQSVYEWLGSVVNMCNKKLGTPFERCNKAFEDAVDDCKAKLGSFFGGACNISYLVGAICYIVKPLDFICDLVSFVSDAIVNVVRKKIKKFAKHMKAMFYVKVKFSHSFHFESNRSRSNTDISKGITTEIKQRTEKFFLFFDMLSCLTSVFILLIFVRVIFYRYKWLTNPRFDNRYLTNYLRDIDLRRARLDKETVLPLNPRERNKYVPLSSIRLIKAEKMKLTKSAVFMSLISFKLLFQMAIDYSLFWILNVIRYHGRFETKITENSVGVHVSGNGFLAELYRSIVKAFSLSSEEEEIDMVPCLPDPIPPNYDRYLQILTLMFFSWLIIIFEPYGLRMRQCVMISYHPERAKERAVWLYNHILRSRGNFLKFARRQLRRKFGMQGGQTTEKVTLKERLIAICPLLRKCFSDEQKICILCGAVERDKQLPHIKCPTPGCVGLFCAQCFKDLQNMCTVCKTPMDYGDLSDMSEEKDSSEEEARARKSAMSDASEELDESKLYEDRKMEEGANVIEEDIGPISSSSSSSSTEYSYTYQDDESQIDRSLPQKVPFKDVEAQKSRDEVSTQIFSSQTEDVESESESQACFGLRSRKRQKSKLDDSSKASQSSEEFEDEDRNVHLDEESKFLLPKYQKEKKEKKHSRLKKFFTGLLKFFWFGKKRKSEKVPKDYKRMGNADDEKLYSSSFSTSSSLYSIEYEEQLKVKSYDSLQEIQRDKDKRILRYPHEKQFCTKELPSGLMSIAERTKYFQVDERLNYHCRCSNDKQDLNHLSDTKTSSDTSEITEIWNKTDEENQNYQSDCLDENNESKRSTSSLITSAKEDMQESSRSINIQHDFSESPEDAKNYIDVTGVSSDSSVHKRYVEKSRDELTIQTRDDNQITNDEAFFYEPKVRQTEKQVSSETLNDRRNHQKLTTEKRLLRRRYNENYYSSSENDKKSLSIEKGDENKQRNEAEESLNKSKCCKHCGKRKTTSPTREHFREDYYSQKNCKLRGRENKSILHSQTIGRSSSENLLDKNVKLIRELEEDERMKSIRKREDDRQKRCDIVRYIREHGSSQRDSKICQTSPRAIRARKKRNILPYQETEAFKSLLKEYKEKAVQEEKLTHGEFSEKSLSTNQLRSESTIDTFYLFQKQYQPEEYTDTDETTN